MTCTLYKSAIERRFAVENAEEAWAPCVGPDREGGEDLAVVVHIDRLTAVVVQRAGR